MNRLELAASRHSFRLAENILQSGVKLPIPSWVPEQVSSRIMLSCHACQDFIDIHYGSAECTVCPLADFVARCNRQP
jgi:hypothetical protein